MQDEKLRLVRRTVELLCHLFRTREEEVRPVSPEDVLSVPVLLDDQVVVHRGQNWKLHPLTHHESYHPALVLQVAMVAEAQECLHHREAVLVVAP